MLVKCDAKTCTNYKEGVCKAQILDIKNFTWYSEEINEETDEMKCETYEYDQNWMLK